MLNHTKKQVKKGKTYLESFAKWVVRTAFEVLQLSTVGLTVMSLIQANRYVEFALSGIVMMVTFAVTKTKVLR